jgi:hypothetical protein
MNKEEIASIKQSLKQYTGTKTIMATPMTRGEYNALRGWQVPADEDPSDAGYLVEYQNDSKSNVEGFDGYISWSPQKPFEEAYRASGAYDERLIIEMEELTKKICKLDEYLRNMDPTKEDFYILNIQLGIMQSYFGVLRYRYDKIKKNFK